MLTFTEDEAKWFQEFGAFVLSKAKWDLTTAEAITLAKHIGACQLHAKKLQDHIMEIRSVKEVAAEPAAAEPKGKAKR